MGLDTSHDCWHGPYSSFGEWRTAIARAAGRPIAPNEHGRERYVLDPQQWAPLNFQGWWDRDPDDPLDVLLVHSDCDGYIFEQFCEPLARRLEGLLPDIPAEWQKETQQFIDGLLRAADDYQVVGFH